MVFDSGTAFADSDVDDEFDHSMRSSPVQGGTDSEGLSAKDHTPTTYGTHLSGDTLLETVITEWTVDDCAEFVCKLGLHQYGDRFIENEIVGEALVALLHDDLKQMGITSAGHRLTILKNVFDIKVKQDVPVENDHYVPLSANTEAQYATATLKDIKHLIEQLRLRDERMSAAESELRRITLEYNRLREDLLPVFRMAREGKPLPYPSSNSNGQIPHSYDSLSSLSPSATMPSIQSANDLGRTYSTKKFFMDHSKNASPTSLQPGHDRSILNQALESAPLSERPKLSSSHLSVTNNGSAVSPGHPSPNQHSPTSPKYSASRSYRSEQTTPGRSNFPNNDNDQHAPGIYSRDSANAASSRRGQPSNLDNSSSGGSVEIFKSFRVSMDDPCYKVLPAALKKYNINAPWEQYALFIVYGDNERCLDMDEKPLILFKQLDKEGKKPMFMLRKITPSTESQADTGGSGLDRSTSRVQVSGYNDPPGGII
ncbi:Mitogen-activated protein kinase adapter protein [Podosphaera aphanis]|nr:Mitogen-activated protein kinase adapter protein [Podosphaera aphanis]